ncbi:TRAP transporter large permease subunit [Xanthobacteraceae bacterium Astr-EGSB]|uniref:TRAP transporter large permease n=1 Tax=Astrobacterium formosum TaxID=3069710 RepID=UPI0027AF2D13|nr:TRAP transporter large permease subunit [Xanthobacteraceae bacterium Astr-EGSB]
MTIVIFLCSLVAAMAIGVPVAFALIFCGLVLMAWMGLDDPQIVASTMVGGVDQFTLLAVPFFLLAGELMNAGGLSRRIVNFSVTCVGHLRGGLGVVTILAAVIMASLSGSPSADTAALAAILIPMMREAGYDVARSTGLMAAGGIIAPIIPPSIAFIIFGVVANVSITGLFMGGIVPGLLMAISLLIAWYFVSRRETVELLPRRSARERWLAFRSAGWALFMPVIVIGGIRFGVFTPTEAAIAAAAYALFVGLAIYREMSVRRLWIVFRDAAKTTSVVMFLIASAMLSAYLITLANIPVTLHQYIEPFVAYPRLLLTLIMILVLFVGTALDLSASVLILTPVLMPIIKQAGIDPIYFGVLFIMNASIGMITPPVGIVLNVVSSVARVPLGQVIRGISPFLIALVCVLFLLVAFPQLVLVPLAVLR